MVQLGAAKFLLATGAGVPPSPPSTTVNIGISTERAGFVIDLRDDPSQPLPANWDREPGVVIDGTAEEVKGTER
jgi:hypothetical protein